MVWAWEAILLVGIAHLVLSVPSFEDRSPLIPVVAESQDDSEVRRSSFPLKTSSNLNRIEMVKDKLEDGSSKSFVSSPLLYHLEEELRPSDSASQPSSQGDFFQQNWRPEGQNIFPFANSREENNALENISEEERNLVSKTLRESMEEPVWLKKRRLQMKGPGLFGNSLSRNILGQKSLTGYRGTKNKGLVLSIDLGIKALRDAILHAKVQQKNRKLQAQAQKNMRLLHNIGKRRASSDNIFVRP